jgi:hypothetical protein
MPFLGDRNPKTRHSERSLRSEESLPGFVRRALISKQPTKTLGKVPILWFSRLC